jgi:AraC-like DNA-binding protein
MEERFESARRTAPAALRPYVAAYTGYRQDGGQPGRHRGLPSPYVTFILTLDDPCEVAVPSDPKQQPHAYATLLGGLHKVPTIIAHPGRQSGIQLALEPLGARALLGLPAGELANLDVQASDVLGPLADELYARVREAETWKARFDILDEVLARRLQPERAVAHEVAEAWWRLKQAGGDLEVGELATTVGWCERHLNGRFRDEIGLSPKAAARVIRFHRARGVIQRHVAAGTGGSLADVAADCGYYDQAHLAREFREIAGCSPSQWVAEEFRNVQAFSADDGADSEA